MRKNRLLFLLFLSSFCLTSCEKQNPKENDFPAQQIDVISVNIEKENYSVGVDSAIYVSASVGPTDATNKELIWTSSNIDIATVDHGFVTGVSRGEVTITAKSAENQSIFDTCLVNVGNYIPTVGVTGVSLDKSSVSMYTGETYTLNETVAPTDATNKNVLWTSSNENVATVNGGVVTAKAAGQARIYVTTIDGNFSAYCDFNITEKVTIYHVESVSLNYTNYTLKVNQNVQLSPTILPGNATNKNVSWSSTNSNIVSVSNNGLVTAKAVGNADIVVKTEDGNKSATCHIVVETNTVSVTKISVTPSSSELTIGETLTLTASVSPSNATNKNVSWSSSNSQVASISSSGVVTAKAVGTATMTATATDGSGVKGTASITVSNSISNSSWTILIYMCGSSLESGYDYISGEIYDEDGGFATSDIQEILSVNGQPSDVNIVLQTGGSYDWKKYNISANYNQRYIIKNKQLTCVNSKVYSSYKSMGATSTLQDFLTWGINTYPADKTALILWNHGSGMKGVCFDEKKNDDCLTNDKVRLAVSNSLKSTEKSKLEFIGYDACLMAFQDAAEFNSPYFNYMVASQESEAGKGWDYDTWLDDLYQKKSTTTILKAICDGFINDNGGVNGKGTYYSRSSGKGTYYEPANQTLAYYNLNCISEYKDAWENMASMLSKKLTRSNASTFRNNIIGKTYCFGYDYDYNDPGNDYFFLYDVGHFISLLEKNSTFNPGEEYISDVKTAFSNFVEYSIAQKEAAHDANGLSFYFVSSSDSNAKNFINSTYSNFNNWNTINDNYGGSLTYSYHY